MNIVKPYAGIYGRPDGREQGVELLQLVEKYARLSHRSEDRQTPDSWERLIQAVVLDHGDWSVTEHVHVTAFVICDRGISHEWVRHRLGAYTQESTRFCNYGKLGGAIDVIEPFGLTEGQRAIWLAAARHAEEAYLKLIDGEQLTTSDARAMECVAYGHDLAVKTPGRPKLAPQLARSVLPTSLATRLYVTYNLRMWRHFLLMRTCAEAHPQMRQVTDALLRQFQERIPLLYDDVTPGERQADALRRAR